jgi:O-antigen ligase
MGASAIRNTGSTYRTLPFTDIELSSALFLLGELLVVGTWVAYGNILILPAVVIALLALYQSLQSLVLWATFVVLSYVVLFLQVSEGISVVEVAFACLFYGGFALWFIDRWFVKRERMLASPGDLSLILFLLFAAATIVTAVVAQNKILLWFREYLMLTGFLLYFPLREVFRKERDRKVVYGAFFLIALIIASHNLYRYRSGAIVATFLWELVGARQAVNEPLMFAVIVAGVAVWMTTAQRWIRWLSLLIVVFFTLSLILTFSRGYWIGTIVGIAILFLVARPGERRKLVQLSLIGGIGGVGLMFLVFPKIFYDLALTIINRFFTSALALEDKSVANRVAESEVVWKLISRNPIAGAGLGSEISYFHLLRQSTQHTYYMHNAYLYLWFKLGLIGLVVFLTAFVSKIKAGYTWLKTCGDDTRRVPVMAALAILVAMMEITITSPQFYARDSILIIVLCWATIASSVAGRDE